MSQSPAVEVSALPSVPLAAKTKGCCCGGETAKVKEAIGSCCSRCDGMAESNGGSCCGPPWMSEGCIGIPVEQTSAVYGEQQRVLASAKGESCGSEGERSCTPTCTSSLELMS